MIKYKVLIGEKVHTVTLKILEQILQMGKEKCDKANYNAIYAVRKNNLVELRDDIFKDRELMDKEIKKYRNKKIKVYYTQQRNVG